MRMAEAVKIELPDDQEFFKLNEVCKLANVQPYMLRFWGTEFEQLETTTTETGQRLYSRPQMMLILEIRRLLFDEGLTIAGARREVDSLIESGKLDLEEAAVDQPAERKKPAVRKPKAKVAQPVPKTSAEPAVKITAAPEVDKAPRADVQPLLATLRGVRKELAEIVAELRK
jgi:DNA-binding transcriptional MerR regulator